VDTAVICGWKGVVDIHNHPSNLNYGPILFPSTEDWVSTYKLYEACKQKGIKFYGSYITSVGEYREYFYSIASEYRSLLQEGFL